MVCLLEKALVQGACAIVLAFALFKINVCFPEKFGHVELWFFDGSEPAGRQGFKRILVTEADHPYVGAWWPDGHIIGWEHSFTHQVAELLWSIRDGSSSSPSFADGLRVQRVLGAIEASSAANGASISIPR